MSKIVVLTDSLGSYSGGLAHATLNLALATAKALPDHQFRIISQSDKSEIDVGQVNPRNLSIVKYLGYRNNIFPYSFSAFHMLCEFNPDLLHLRGLWRQSSIIAARWKRKTNKPLIVQTAGMLEPWARRRNSFTKKVYYHFIESNVLSLADRIHATSTLEKQSLILLGLPEHKIFIVEEGVHIPKNDHILSPKFANGNHTNMLLFLARLHPVKGVELLLESLSLLRPRNWHCTIAGMGTPGYVSKLHKLAQTYGINDLVSFCGPLSGAEKEKALSEASAFILPSYSESFGISIAEALSWGLPVITTSETPWSIIQEKNMGWIVPPNSSSISKAIFQLTQASRQELLEMGNRGRVHVSERYDWRQLGLRMSEVYQSLCN